MIQRIEVNENGLNIVQLGAAIDTIPAVMPLRLHPNRNLLLTGFNEEFEYYFINGKGMFLGDAAVVKDLFIAAGKRNEIVGVFLVIEPNTQITNILNEAFGSAKLQSNSSIEGINTGGKTFWKKNDVSVFLTATNVSLYSTITIRRVPFDNKAPEVYIQY